MINMSLYDFDTIVFDTSAVIESIPSFILNKKDFNYLNIIIPEAVLSELEHQANSGISIGFKGLKELKKLQKAENDGLLSVSFKGKRPSSYDIANAKKGEIDAIIRDTAKSELGVLYTCDKVQAEVAKAQGIPVKLFKPDFKFKKLAFMRYFDDETMSVHLKEDVVPMAKKGKPGNFQLEKIRKTVLSREKIIKLADEILETAREDNKSYFESEMDGSVVIQLREFRISIAQPPFSEAFEITIVKPVAHVSLEDYRLPDKLMERLKTNAEGILISGSPGAGKSTFAQALAEFYLSSGKVVKTMESPRDLQVPSEITQYSPLDGSMENTADILLLVRPDYTIYDELRKTSDFNIFSDMRLSGVGMIGVVHATRPIDAIQRISSRVELGMIPSIVDTSIYIEDGQIKAVYKTKMTVKVPSGMIEQDLARPVIEIRDFETDELKNEIYTYGEQTIVMDVNLTKSNTSRSKSSVDSIAESTILNKIRKIIPKSNVQVEILSPERANVYINEKYIPKVIGKKGKRIAEIEKEIGISLGIESIEDKSSENEFNESYFVELIETKKQVILSLGFKNSNKNFDIYIGEEYLLTATTSKNGEIKIKKGVELADILLDAVDYGYEITAIRK